MTTSVDNFLVNLEFILAATGWSNRHLAQKSDISDRLIGMYRRHEAIPSMDKAERISRACGFELWQMQMPDFRIEIIRSKHFAALIRAYIGADDEGRRVMDSLAQYLAKK